MPSHMCNYGDKMLLTTQQTCEILSIHYQTIVYHLRCKNFKTAKKYGRDWLIESWEVLEMREAKLKRQQQKKRKKV